MNELAQVARLRDEVPEDLDLSAAEAAFRAGAAGRPRRRRSARPLLATGLTAAAAAGVVVAATMGGGDGGTPTARPVANVAALMDRAAGGALAEPAPEPGQVIYQESVARRRVQGGVTQYIQHHESWLPVDGSRHGLIREKNLPLPGGEPLPATDLLPPAGETTIEPCGAAPPLDRPYLDGVPADPDALLRLIERQDGDGERGDRLWATATDLVGRPAPPKVRAAIFRAIAKIPGVRLVPDSVDANGRHGVAVGRAEGGLRSELVFDRATYRYLGERTVVTKAGGLGPAGTVTGSGAVVRTLVVDRVPQPGPQAVPATC